MPLAELPMIFGERVECYSFNNGEISRTGQVECQVPLPMRLDSNHMHCFLILSKRVARKLGVLRQLILLHKLSLMLLLSVIFGREI